MKSYGRIEPYRSCADCLVTFREFAICVQVAPSSRKAVTVFWIPDSRLSRADFRRSKRSIPSCLSARSRALRASAIFESMRQ